MHKLAKLTLLCMFTAGGSRAQPLSAVSLPCVGAAEASASPPPVGLTLIAASAADGVVGAYREDDRVVYFRAQRGGINAEWFLPGNTPKYAVTVELLDRNCHPFFSNGEAPNWRPGKKGTLTAAEIAPHQADMRLTGAALDALRAARLPPVLSPELEALTMQGGFFRSLRTERQVAPLLRRLPGIPR